MLTTRGYPPARLGLAPPCVGLWVVRASIAIKRDNVIGARDQRTTSGPTGIMTHIKQAEDMTAPTIIVPQQNNP